MRTQLIPGSPFPSPLEPGYKANLVGVDFVRVDLVGLTPFCSGIPANKTQDLISTKNSRSRTFHNVS